MIVGLVMLVLITLTVIAAFTLSQANLKAVGNIQMRNEAVAAANRAIEEVVTSLLPATAPYATPVETQSDVDINNDGTVDYKVKILAPVCVRAALANPPAAGAGGPGGIGGGQTSSTVKTGSGSVGIGEDTGGSGSPPPSSWDGAASQYFSVWDINASVVDVPTGAVTTVRDGVRVLLNQKQAQQFCGVT